MTADRKALHVNLSDDAHDQMRAFCDEHGISVAAFIETFASGLPDYEEALVCGLSASEFAKDARKVDAVRRKRGRR